MTETAQNLPKPTHKGLKQAVHKHKALSRKGVGERLFTLAFRGLVYPQIWEDPLVDQEALQIGPDCHIITIASGGCNVLSYLVEDPARVTAVDLNRAHVALTRLKLCAAKELPDYDTFFSFFGDADDKANVKSYDTYIKPKLDQQSRSYWERRTLAGARRIRMFARNVYRQGLLGKFIGAGHLVARLYGRNPKDMLRATSIEEQREVFEDVIAPLFGKKLIRWMVNRPVSLYGLGIPPAQYEALSTSGDGDMAGVLRERLEKLACDFAIDENYFARQAFGRSYAGQDAGALPPYLQRQNYETVRSRVDRVDVNQISFTVFLSDKPDQSFDRYILLDAQDWMNDDELTALWSEVTRTAKPGARVIFRTAAEESLLPGRIPDEILNRWDYDLEHCRELTRKDRSSIYGGFHLYVLKG